MGAGGSANDAQELAALRERVQTLKTDVEKLHEEKAILERFMRSNGSASAERIARLQAEVRVSSFRCVTCCLMNAPIRSLRSLS